MFCLKNKTKPNQPTKQDPKQTNKHKKLHKTTKKPKNLKTVMRENHNSSYVLICPAMKPEQVGCGRVLRVDYKTPHQNINIPH